MEAGQLNSFQQALVKAYYYLVIVDGMVDPKELTFGSQMVEREGIDRDKFEDLLDSFTYKSGNEVRESLIEDLEKLSNQDQTKIVAYMSSLADADGITDISEKNIIHDLCFELNLEFKEILYARQNLKSN